jgi:hypothetical protein
MNKSKHPSIARVYRKMRLAAQREALPFRFLNNVMQERRYIVQMYCSFVSSLTIRCLDCNLPAWHRHCKLKSASSDHRLLFVNMQNRVFWFSSQRSFGASSRLYRCKPDYLPQLQSRPIFEDGSSSIDFDSILCMLSLSHSMSTASSMNVVVIQQSRSTGPKTAARNQRRWRV